MSLAAVRSRIYTTLSGAVVLGYALNTQAQVHDYFRTVTTEKELGERLFKKNKLHAWMISLGKDEAFLTTRSDRGQVNRRGPEGEFALYRFYLYGYYGVEDAAESEKVWADIVEDVIDAFRADKKLGNTVIDSGPAQWEQGGGGEGCVMMPPGDKGRLCHFARLTLEVFEALE